MPNQHSREGKLTFCMNNLRHGSISTSLSCKGENPEDFFALLKNAFEQYKSAFDHDAALVLRAMKDHWILLRRERALEVFEAAQKESPSHSTPTQSSLHRPEWRNRRMISHHNAISSSVRDAWTED